MFSLLEKTDGTERSTRWISLGPTQDDVPRVAEANESRNY